MMEFISARADFNPSIRSFCAGRLFVHIKKRRNPKTNLEGTKLFLPIVSFIAFKATFNRYGGKTVEFMSRRS